MAITAECIVEHGMLKLPKSLSLPDGIRVMVNIEPTHQTVQRKKIARDLAGSWHDDATICTIFSEIAADRSSYFGRDVTIP